MNNEGKILNILQSLQADVTAIKGVQQAQGEKLDNLEKGQKALQAEVTVTIRLQQVHGQKLDAQGKDITIIKNSESHLTTQGEAIFAGLLDTQATGKTTQTDVKILKEDVKEITSQMVTKADLRNLSVREKALESRVENLEEHTNAPKIHQN